MSKPMKLTYPLETTFVKVSPRGSHYHALDCPMTVVTRSQDYYLTIEVPKMMVDKDSPIYFLGRRYERHLCLLCLDKSYRLVSEYFDEAKLKSEMERLKIAPVQSVPVRTDITLSDKK